LKLRITLDTHHSLVVEQLLEEEGLIYTEPDMSPRPHTFVLETRSDIQYREWQLWIAAALACGLLYGGRIERE